MVQISKLHVSLAPGGFFPQAFRWEGRSYRVLAVQSVRTHGPERRIRVASSGGSFELALNTRDGIWQVRRAPHPLLRLWHRWQNGARYPLPAWRRRARVAPQPVPVHVVKSTAAWPEQRRSVLSQGGAAGH